MITPPIGVPTRSLRLPLRRALAAAAELGADGVELDLRHEVRPAEFGGTALREFRRLLEEQRLRVLAGVFPLRRGLDDPEELDRRVRATCEAMTFAYQLGARSVVVRLGSIPGDETESHAALIESLTLLAAHGDRVGARLAIASGDDPAEQARLLDRLPEGTLGVALHPALLVAEGHSPPEAAAVLGERVHAVYAADAVREVGASVAEVPLGRGQADLPDVLATLAEHDYRGPILVERRSANDVRAAFADAIAYVRALGL